MKIQNTDGNLLRYPRGVNVFIHQANVNARMGSGIAAQIKQELPELYYADIHYPVPVGVQRLGKCSTAVYYRDGDLKLGINLYGQRIDELSKDGIPTDYDAVQDGFLSALREIKAHCVRYPEFKPVIGLPYLMGCALGGADWEEYSDIINSILEDTEWEVYAVKFNPDSNKEPNEISPLIKEIEKMGEKDEETLREGYYRDIEESKKRRDEFPDEFPPSIPQFPKFTAEKNCGKCGIPLDRPIGYVCTRTDCPHSPKYNMLTK